MKFALLVRFSCLLATSIGDHVAAVLVAPDAVAGAISRWLQEQNSAPLGELPVAAWAFEGPADVTLAARGTAPERPADVLLPVHTRFGSWQLRAWDPVSTVVVWHVPTLVGAGSGALLFALLGAGLYFQQRGALRRAEQRVSFVNQVSHELRAPLTNILLNLDIARESVDANEATRRLELVQEEARRLGRLIDNVLTFSRREQGPIRLVPQACSPASVVSAVVDQFAPSFARRGLEVRCRRDGESEPCLLDADALAQILANLLSNVELPSAGRKAAVHRRDLSPCTIW